MAAKKHCMIYTRIDYSFFNPHFIMQWIKRFQLFLFDFDGLLVNSEHLHFQAYIQLCARRGYKLSWDFSRFSDAAHHKSTDLRDQIYAEFPALYAEEPDWHILYEEKKQIFLELVHTMGVEFMPGAFSLLEALQEENINRCVVTNSALPLIALIREQNPLLDTIPHWITREHYSLPKPDPECYLTAIAKLAKPEDRIIGFEDSPKGLNALLGTRATPILICPPDIGYLPQALKGNVRYYSSFLDITDENAP